jgi:hypothetical protein
MTEIASGRKDYSRRFDTCDHQHEPAPVLAAALDYAAQGWAVFPCLPNAKEPATKRGFKDATTNPATIRRWWLARPDYNVGVATGIISRVFILDVDGANGAQTLADLEAEHGSLPTTKCSITSAGCHLWFRADGYTQSSAARLGPGLDVRADGGYVIAPPSIHPDGSVYRWSNGTPPAPATDWLLRLARTRTVAPTPNSTPDRTSSRRRDVLARVGNYGLAALESEIDLLANAPLGTRNHALNRASFCLHQLVAGGELDRAIVHDRLVAASHANGLMADPLTGRDPSNEPLQAALVLACSTPVTVGVPHDSQIRNLRSSD